MISNSKTPKLKTSDFSENTPLKAYSGDIYPLQILVLSKVNQNDICFYDANSNYKRVAGWGYNQFLLLHLECMLIGGSERLSIEKYGNKVAYYVPATRWVCTSCCCFWNVLAKPKSEIFGFISSSKRILLTFRSRCIMFRQESRCRYSSPLATPWMMLNRLGQSSNSFCDVSDH